MRYLLFIILEMTATVIAYITNPVVCLFANDHGNLPRILRWWQTWDNTLDVRWMVYEPGCVWSLFQYDYDRHYIYYYENHEHGVPGHVILIDPHFTKTEKIKRYFCRLAWMYRNCNYGFSYEVTGCTVDPDTIKIVRNIDEPDNEQWLSYETGKSIWDTHWSYYYEKPYCRWFKLRIYLGWKLKGVRPGSNQTRHMLALYIWPFRKVA